MAQGPSLRKHFENVGTFTQDVLQGYAQDAVLGKVAQDTGKYSAFTQEDGMIEIVLEQAHSTLGHMGAQRTSEYIRRYFWWPTLGKDVDKFCTSCATCQVNKPRSTLQAGLLHSLPIPTQPWTSIAMDFVGPFPRSI